MDDALRDDLRAGIIDMTISPARATPANEALVSRGLLSDTVVVVAHKDHQLAGRPADPPPLKWSAVMFRKRRIENGKQATEGGRDCLEVTSG